MKPTFQRVALAAVLGFGLVVSAAAQDRGPSPGAAGPGGATGARGADRQKLFEDMRHMREQRLHDLLQIRPEQETAFRTFVSSLKQARPQRGARQGDRGQRGPGRGGAPAERTALTTPERLDRQAQRLVEAQQRLQKEQAAVKIFYVALSADQRKAFDAMGGEGLGRGGGSGRRGMQFEGRQFR